MKNSIKIWPKLDDITQALIPYSNSNLNETYPIHLDLTNVRDVNASGATMTLVKLIENIRSKSTAVWVIEPPERIHIDNCLNKIGFYKILDLNIINKDIFWRNDIILENESYVSKNRHDLVVKSFPIYHLQYQQQEKREVVEEFSNWINEILYCYCKQYDFKLNIIAKLLKEIAKNSEDHTKDSAFFGIDILENAEGSRAELIFSFCDLGIGLFENIKSFLRNNSKYRKDAYRKIGIVDAYHLAFSPGFTTSTNKINKGIGMSMILDCVQILGMELSFFDAHSRGFIPSERTHSEIRRNFWDTGNKVGFNYYGRLVLKKN